MSTSIWNENKDVVLFFAGEHFSNITEFENIRKLGHNVLDNYNASYLVHLYEDNLHHRRHYTLDNATLDKFNFICVPLHLDEVSSFFLFVNVFN